MPREGPRRCRRRRHGVRELRRRRTRIADGSWRPAPSPANRCRTAWWSSAREPTLAGIIDRAIDHLHPAELDAIRRRWSLGDHPETLWERRRPQIELGAALGFGVVLLLVAWAVSLRTQIQRRVAAGGAMRAAKEEAETANRAKSTFLATMSHEIRTPMNAVLGLLELELRSPGERAATERSLAIAHQAARDLLGLIDDILDVAKIEAERLDARARAAGTRCVGGGRRRDLRAGRARRRALLLVIEKSGAAGSVWVEADAQRLRQVAGNLLSNAIKFTENGQRDAAIQRRRGRWTARARW